MTAGKRLSARKYADHRKAAGLHGQSPQAVLAAIRAGRLEGAVERNDRGHWSIDPVAADRLWSERTVTTKQRGERNRGGRPPREPAGAGPLFGEPDEPEGRSDRLAESKGETLSMRKAQEVRATYQAALTQLDYQERSGALVRAAAVQSEQFTIARQVREAVLQVPDRIAAQLAAEGDELQVRNLLNEELTAALRQLSRELARGSG